MVFEFSPTIISSFSITKTNLLLNVLFACLVCCNFALAVTPLFEETTNADQLQGSGYNLEPDTATLGPKVGLNQKLLVISFDGFRQLYFENNRFLPWFAYFRRQGVYSDRVQSIFPSETFPNHFAIVTGMYAESHGVVGNNMYDPKANVTFTKSDNSPLWWSQAEPIWVTAERQNIHTAVSFWPGSAVKYPPGNFTPSIYREVYDATVPYEERIEETVENLKKPDIRLAFLYYNQPDSDGHQFGAGSQNVIDRLVQVDWYLSHILRRLDEEGLGRDKLNIVICSDHGMTNLTNPLYLEDFVSKDDLERVPAQGPVVNIQPKEGKVEEVYRMLRGASRNGQPFDVYRKADVPTKYHYSNNDRIMDIIVVCRLGTYMKTSRPASKVVGVHGYDPAQIQMKPIFMARGPAFKTGGYRAAKVFETKDIYAIMTYVTGIVPRATNASLDLVWDMFNHDAASAAPCSSLTSSPLFLLMLPVMSTIFSTLR